jgi:hypothetical protein
MRRNLTTRFVAAISVLTLLLCVGWAVLAQHAVPNACTHHPPPPRALYLHC